MPELGSIRHPWPARALVALCLIVAGACGGAGGSPGAPEAVAISDVACTGTPRDDLGPNDVCVDSGVRPKDLLQFRNWSGNKYEADNFGVEEMIALYGSEAVCLSIENYKCVQSQSALVRQQELTDILTSGRCEGMTVLSALYMASRGPTPESLGAESIPTLSPEDSRLVNVVDFWWSTQFIDYTRKYSSGIRAEGVRSVLEQILTGLDSQWGVTVGIYFEGGGHSLLPIAVTKTGDRYVVHTWDSNSPGEFTQLELDPIAGTWRFTGARRNPDEAPKEWSGTNGSIDATPLFARKGDAVGRPEASRAAAGDTTITVVPTKNGVINLTLDSVDGTTIELTTEGTTGIPDGLTVEPLRDGAAEGFVLNASATLGIVGATAEIAEVPDDSPNAPSPDSAEASDAGRVSVRSADGMLTSISIPRETTNGTIDLDLVTTSANERPASRITTDVPVTITAASQETRIEIPVLEPQTITIETPTMGDATTVEVVLAGESPVSTTIQPPAEGATQAVSIAPTGDAGLEANVMTPEPLSIDPAQLARIEDSKQRLLEVPANAAFAPDATPPTSSTSSSPNRSTSTSIAVESTTSSAASGTTNRKPTTNEKLVIESLRPALIGVNGATFDATASSRKQSHTLRIDFREDLAGSPTNSTPTVRLDTSPTKTMHRISLEGLTAATRYSYRAVIDDVPDASWSLFETRPAAASGVTLSAADGALTIAWTSSTKGNAVVVSHKATLKPGGRSCTTTSSTCSITGLTNGTEYTVTVTSTTQGGDTISSEAPTATPSALTFAAPSISSVKPTGATASVNLPFIGGEVELKVEYQSVTGGGTLLSIDVSDPTSTSKTRKANLSNLRSATKYRVRAIASQNGSTVTSPYSEFITAPEEINEFTAVFNGTDVVVSWNEVGAASDVAVTYTATVKPGDTKCSVVDSSTCTLTGMARGREYTVSLVASTSGGSTEAASTVNVSTAIPEITDARITRTSADPAEVTVVVDTAGRDSDIRIEYAEDRAGATVLNQSAGTVGASPSPVTKRIGIPGLTIGTRYVVTVYITYDGGEDSLAIAAFTAT